MRLISADSHVDIGHDSVKEGLASRYHDGYDAAVAAYTATRAGGIAGTMSNHGEHWDRLGHFDGREHLKDMDIDGVDIEVVYCEVSAFRFLYLLEEGGPEATRAFNDVLADYASADPLRLIVSYQIPIHDIPFAVSEVQRIAAHGGRSLQFPVFPTELGVPDYYHERYDPLWASIQQAGLPICCHTGHNAGLYDLQRRDPTPGRAISVPMIALSTAEALGMWILGGVLERFPGLKLVFVEPGLGWVAWWLSYVDEMITHHGYANPALSQLPSFYFDRNVHITFMNEPEALHLQRHRLGIESIMWASDYPHPPTTWPNSRALVASQFDGIPVSERDAIVAGNAARVWNLA